MKTNELMLAEAFRKEAVSGFEKYLPRIVDCLQLLSEEEIWWRPNEASNSAGNLVLHLCGNVRQWIISGLAAEPDARDCRPLNPLDARPQNVHRLRHENRTYRADAKGNDAAVDAADRTHTRRISGTPAAHIKNRVGDALQCPRNRGFQEYGDPPEYKGKIRHQLLHNCA